MSDRYQFSLKSILEATFWLAIGAGLLAQSLLHFSGQVDRAFSGLLICSIFIGMGAGTLRGHRLFGAICGLLAGSILLPVWVVLVIAPR